MVDADDLRSDGRAELVTQATKFIRGYDPATGKELWRLSGNSEIAIPDADRRPRHGHRHQRLPRRAADLRDQARRHAATSRSRPAQTKNEFIAWSTNRGGPYIPTPVIYGDQLYVLPTTACWRPTTSKTGQRVYQERVGGGGSFSASPVAADGKLYLTSEDGDVFVVKAGPTYELLATNAVGEVAHGDAGDLGRRDHHSRPEARHRDRSEAIFFFFFK